MTQHEISTILQAIARLEVKVDGLGDNDSAAAIVARDFELRLRAVEKTRNVAIGLAIALGGSAGALARGLLGG